MCWRISLGKITGSEIAMKYDKYLFILLNSAKRLAKVVVSIYISTSSMTTSVVQVSCNRRLKFFINVMDVKWFFIVLIYIFLIFSDVEDLFICFFSLLCNSIFIYFASLLSFVYLFLIALWKFFIPFFGLVCCKYISPD